MNLKNEYLTDEELARLILEVEENELVSAPPSFAEEMMAKIGEAEERKKTIEFRRYCVRVLGSVAASIVLVFFVQTMEPKEVNKLPTREEVIGKSVAREDVLDDRTFMTKLMSDFNQQIGGILNETEKEK